MPFNPKIHHRKSIRLETHDYSRGGVYYVTICVHDHACLFGKIVNGQMNLSAIGVIANTFWYEIKNHAHHVEMQQFVVMPNHIHGIIEILNDMKNVDHVVGVDIADVDNVDMDNVDMDNVDMDNVDMDNVDMDNVDMDNVDMDNADMDNVDMDNVDMDIVDMDVVDMDIVDMDNVDMDNVDMDIAANVGARHALPLPPPPPPPPPPPHKPQNHNHPHRFQNQGKNSLSSIVGSYKSAVSKHAHRMGFTDFKWQRNYFEHIIRSPVSHARIAEYILKNPIKWENDQFFRN